MTNALRPKQPYVRPRLQRLGSMAALTAGGPVSGMENMGDA